MFTRGRISDRLPDVEVIRTRLPSDLGGLTDGLCIWLDDRMTQTQRRCVIAHERVQCERPVDRIAASRLVELGQLVDALLWMRHAAELVDELWVDAAAFVVHDANGEPDGPEDLFDWVTPKTFR